MQNLEAHPLALMFPPISPEEMAEIVSDVKKHGVLEPVWLYEGKVLDGWHRYCAAVEAGKEAKFREWRGDDPWAFVVSMNIMRRHLTAEMRAATMALAAKKVGALVRLEPGRVDTQLGSDEHHHAIRTPEVMKSANVGQQTALRAVRVADAAPELAEKVAAGQMSLTDADLAVRGAGTQERHQKHEAKKEQRKHEDNPREVKRFIDATAQYDAAVRDAFGVIKAGKFTPEAARFAARKMAALHETMRRLENMLEAVK
jgi:hypothetical protein